MVASVQLEGKIVLATGAGSGIGRASAIAAAQAGARGVTVVDINAVLAEETAHLVECAGSSAISLTVDIVDVDAVDGMVAKVIRTYGRLDSAFNNAGVNQRRGMTADIDPDEWNRVFRVNTFGLWLCMRAELPHMAAQESGAIVNTASTAGLRTIIGRSAYVAAKHAVVGLTRNAAVEYADQGIRINAVCPGGVNTPMIENVISSLSSEERGAALKAFAELHPMKRMGEAEEIAEAVVFLLGNRAGFITGQCLGVDGGWTAQ